jgi:hypothetical protein
VSKSVKKGTEFQAEGTACTKMGGRNVQDAQVESGGVVL